MFEFINKNNNNAKYIGSIIRTMDIESGDLSTFLNYIQDKYAKKTGYKIKNNDNNLTVIDIYIDDVGVLSIYPTKSPIIIYYSEEDADIDYMPNGEFEDNDLYVVTNAMINYDTNCTASEIALFISKFIDSFETTYNISKITVMLSYDIDSRFIDIIKQDGIFDYIVDMKNVDTNFVVCMYKKISVVLFSNKLLAMDVCPDTERIAVINFFGADNVVKIMVNIKL